MQLEYSNLTNKLWSKYKTYNPFEICNLKEIPIEYRNINKPKEDTVYLFDKPIILLSDSTS